jgi:hypothetical protein
MVGWQVRERGSGTAIMLIVLVVLSDRKMKADLEKVL